MRSARNVVRVSAAGALLLLAGALVLSAGLPQRSDFTGTYIAGIGRVAPEVGAFAPPLYLRLMNDTTVSIPNLNQLTILNFWATWCAPCEAELPLLQTLYEEGLAYVVAVNMGEEQSHVARWLADRQITLPIALDSDLSITRAYAVRGQPSSYLIQPSGTISRIIFGAVDESTLRASLLP